MIRVWVRCRVCSTMKLLLELELGLGFSVWVNISVRCIVPVLCE